MGEVNGSAYHFWSNHCAPLTKNNSLYASLIHLCWALHLTLLEAVDEELRAASIKEGSCSAMMLCWMETLGRATLKHVSIIANTTLECPWRASRAKLISTATAPWRLSTGVAPYEHSPSHDTTLSRCRWEHRIQVNQCNFIVRSAASGLTDQTWREQDRSSFLGLSGSIASTAGETPGWRCAHNPWDFSLLII